MCLIASLLLLEISVAEGNQEEAKSVSVFAEGVVCTSEFESHFEIDIDGKTVYFVRSTPQFTDWKIYMSNFDGETWSKPFFAPFSGKHLDADPFITPNGKRMFFISNRPDPAKKDASMDIWVMDRKGKGWSEPKRLGAEVNSEQDEWYPTMTRDGTLYFGSARKGTFGGDDIWMSTLKGGKYQKAENIGAPVNSARAEIEPFITLEGNTLIFNAVRPGGSGGLDFYVSRKSGNKWSEPVRLSDPPNSSKTELAPKLSRDGKRFYFTSIREGRLGEILWMDAKKLKL